ncbi:MAG TPA: class I SAM-dependent methyltransferase [Thermoanaerobaculia bacterium]|jgi:SAM-dependent methyltransferase
MLRRTFRFFFPRLQHPLLDAPLDLSPLDRENEGRYRLAMTDDERADTFTAARFAEGVRWRQVMRVFATPPASVLDIGAGNGAIELAFTSAAYRVISVETEWNETAHRLGMRRVIASATALPFRDARFDIVLLLETIEHLAEPLRASAEIARVVRSGGVALITTPPRWRYALRPDPHFGIRFLTLLAPAMQRRVAARRGFGEPHHFVDRIYSSTAQIAKMIAPLRIERVLSRSRLPQRWFWDAIVARR